MAPSYAYNARTSEGAGACRAAVVAAAAAAAALAVAAGTAGAQPEAGGGPTCASVCGGAAVGRSPSPARLHPAEDTYAAFNKPGAVLHWLTEGTPAEEWVLILDSGGLMHAPACARAPVQYDRPAPDRPRA